MRKHATRLLIVCFFIAMIITGCSISSDKPNDKSISSEDLSVNTSRKISMIKINDTRTERILNIDRKKDLLVFINAINASKIITNPAELKHTRYTVNIFYDEGDVEEYYLYTGKYQGHLIGNGNNNAYDLTYKSVVEINKLIERYSKKRIIF